LKDLHKHESGSNEINGAPTRLVINKAKETFLVINSIVGHYSEIAKKITA